MARRASAARKRRPAKASAPGTEDKLLARLRAAEQSLRAIPSGDVDALVVAGRRGARVVNLKGGESAYRMLVEAMSEGAAAVSVDGAVLYCNRRFAELLDKPTPRVIGLTIQSLVHGDQQDHVDEFLRAARKRASKGEFLLRAASGRLIPVQLSVSRLDGFRGHALGMVITDLTEQRQRQQDEIRQAEALHRLVLERELAAQEVERRRIARELHDEAGQLLTSLLVGLRSLEDSKAVTDCQALGRQMREITSRALDELGRLARGLHPTALDDHGLGAAVSRYVDEYSKTHKIAVHLSLNGLQSEKLPPPAQIALYRILQETLTNVARHAHARTARVRFRHSARALEISVTDDGAGFDTRAVSALRSNHLGLQSIRERSAMLGGTATFASGKKGTQVLVKIPLTNWDFPSSVRRRGV